MKIIPVLTEKSLDEAKKGNYTFWVEKGLDKSQIKKVVENIFAVHATKVRTINYRGGEKRNFRGKTQVVKARKKAIVTLSGKEKIDLFEEKKK